MVIHISELANHAKKPSSWRMILAFAFKGVNYTPGPECDVTIHLQMLLQWFIWSAWQTLAGENVEDQQLPYKLDPYSPVILFLLKKNLSNTSFFLKNQ